jgi:enoyl-CoA hydratase
MSTVHVEDKEDGVRVLTLHRPPANAIAPDLLGDLASALHAAGSADSVRSVVLTGNGRFFSAGLDLRQTLDVNEFTGMIRESFKDTFTDLLEFPKPTVAMLNGHAIAGGVVLLLACDYRLGVQGEYKVGLNEVAIGASFPKVAFEIVRLRLTHQQASEVLLGARLYPASEAVRLGFVDELLPADSFEETVLRRAAKLGMHPREAYAHTKNALVAEAVERVKEETDEEAQATASVWMTAESMAARMRQAQKLGKAPR